MEKTFDPSEYVRDLANELVYAFSKANKSTHPYHVGVAKESAVREKLKCIFPESIGIGTGCVIDSFGYTSKQTDIVIYESDICPKFCVNNSEDVKFYPCESVIAVGEIKSNLTLEQLKDSFEHIVSVKKSIRCTKNSMSWRKYCSSLCIEGALEQKYLQIEKTLDQIMGFILCEKIDSKIDTFVKNYIELLELTPNYEVPNIVVSLQDGIIIYLDENNNIVYDTKLANRIFVSKNPDNFTFLLRLINLFIHKGRTSDVFPFDCYFSKEGSIIQGNFYPIKK
ncbi:MAG: DUF6602 domain-containing protein [Paludibacteraceae bacterium]|nr:DUF6602 domain-containing protein [Paludibacteraceae bacterium]